MNQEPTPWKEEFDKRFGHQEMGYFEGRQPLPKLGKSLLGKSLKNFISTEIIEKLIEEAFMEFLEAKQQGKDFSITLGQLRDKWLNN